jgi:hypothetical protein
VFLKLFDHVLEIGITGAKAPRKPVATALGNFLAVGEDFELTSLTGRNDSINVQALLDEGRETRDLGVVVLSGRTVNDFNLHLDLPSDSRRTQRRQGFVELWDCELRRQSH